MEQINEYPNKPLTVRQWKKDNPQLKGKRIILCDHLKNKSMSYISVNLWIGDNSRMLLCPVCDKVHAQTIWERIIGWAMYAVDVTKKVEYSNWIESAGKDKT